ncbi:hypothetical protein JYK14_24555 [Siccirubricoccus sp. KC 17139]|uniref:Uncharacterized protein n=1 Tax=Siccirubricoccus soli TaxID=2899147 RepID=A0ABT1DBJ0_9PROT|nr:hypothetical protein [Siccirubricoccus soli]MCO6419307.1 hypothetical protein [Siccirubricoccus soli]MCP2685442.1 hypothetical protein [Siccirubricoccus soli]
MARQRTFPADWCGPIRTADDLAATGRAAEAAAMMPQCRAAAFEAVAAALALVPPPSTARAFGIEQITLAAMGEALGDLKAVFALAMILSHQFTGAGRDEDACEAERVAGVLSPGIEACGPGSRRRR